MGSVQQKKKESKKKKEPLNCGLAGLAVLLDVICVSDTSRCVCVCGCLYASTQEWLYVYSVHYEEGSHTPRGLWSPESEEDTDTEQRRRFATLEP